MFSDAHEPFLILIKIFFSEEKGLSNLQSTGNCQTNYRFPTDLLNVVGKQTHGKVGR